MKHQTINLVKFKALSRRLNRPLCDTVGVLETLWLFAQHNAKDGDLTAYTPLEIAAWMEWSGHEDELISSLVETGWLDRDAQGRLTIHDWQDHMPNWLKGAQASPAIKHPPSGSLGGPLSEPLSGPPPNLTKPNLTKEQPSVVCAERTSAPSPEPLSSHTFAVKRSKGSNATTWALPQAELDRYVAAYGDHLDVSAELVRAGQWLHANPAKRKTAGGMLSFLTRWLNKSANGHGGAKPVRRGPELDPVKAQTWRP